MALVEFAPAGRNVRIVRDVVDQARTARSNGDACRALIGLRAEPMSVVEFLKGSLMAEHGQRREHFLAFALDADDDGGAITSFLHADAADLLQERLPVDKP